MSRAVSLAAAVELLHTASLIHDDINDCNSLRRGRETVNARWGNSLAILAGDFVFIKMLGLMDSFEPRIIQQLAVCCSAIVEGETLQTANRGNAQLTEELYLEVVSKKTASLFSACAGTGAVLAAGAEPEIAALQNYGFNLGMAFQIKDDLLDVTGDAETLGKPVFTDLRQGTMNLATLFAMNRSQEARVLLAGEDDTARTIELLRDTGALKYAMQRAEAYSNDAKKALGILPECDAKAALRELADFAIGRDQ